MGYLMQALDLINSVSSLPDALKNMSVEDLDSRMIPHKSFARGAMDGTLQFPCLISDAIPIDMASTIGRTLERNYAGLVQIFLSHNNTVNIANVKNPSEFLKQYHKNIRLESTNTDLYYENFVEDDPYFDTLMERIYNGTTTAYINEKENMMVVFNFSEDFNPHVFESNKKELEESLKDIDFEPFPNIGNSPFYEARNRSNNPPLTPQDAHDLYVDSLKKTFSHNLDNRKEMNKLQYGGKINTPAATDNDVKKANDMQPYLIQTRVMAVNNNNEFVQFMDFIVGVKVVLHLIKSDEMIVNLQNSLQNNGKIFNFIRWTTGEKSLFKDLLLKINETKLDIANRSKGASPWWTTLKRIKDTAKAQQAFFAKNQFVPQATIVITAYEADAIQKNTGMPLKDPRFARKLMKDLFLMNFVIVDDGTRTVDILYDGASSYQTYALETLEREVTANSNKIGRELTRMISR